MVEVITLDNVSDEVLVKLLRVALRILKSRSYRIEEFYYGEKEVFETTN